MLRETMSLPGADVIRLRDSNKDLRMGDFVSRVKLAWNREHAPNSRRRTPIDGRASERVVRRILDHFVLLVSFSLSLSVFLSRARSRALSLSLSPFRSRVPTRQPLDNIGQNTIRYILANRVNKNAVVNFPERPAVPLEMNAGTACRRRGTGALLFLAGAALTVPVYDLLTGREIVLTLCSIERSPSSHAPRDRNKVTARRDFVLRGRGSLRMGSTTSTNYQSCRFSKSPARSLPSIRI